MGDHGWALLKEWGHPKASGPVVLALLAWMNGCGAKQENRITATSVATMMGDQNQSAAVIEQLRVELGQTKARVAALEHNQGVKAGRRAAAPAVIGPQEPQGALPALARKVGNGFAAVGRWLWQGG